MGFRPKGGGWFVWTPKVGEKSGRSFVFSLCGEDVEILNSVIYDEKRM